MKKLISILFMGFTMLFAGAEGLTGREIVDKGNVSEISGELKYLDNELYVQTEDVLYQIHLGPVEYAIEIGFHKEIKGSVLLKTYVSGTDIAPITLTHDNKIYRFWDTNGKPMWRGRSYTGGSKNDSH